jgi:hypothetical protein
MSLPFSEETPWMRDASNKRPKIKAGMLQSSRPEHENNKRLNL